MLMKSECGLYRRVKQTLRRRLQFSKKEFPSDRSDFRSTLYWLFLFPSIDYFYEEATALHCKHEHLLINHRELQGDHKLLEREKDDLQQDKVTLRNDNERLSFLVHREVCKNAKLTNHILSLEVRESHNRRELEGYKDLLNQVLNASPQPEVIPTNLNAIITPQRQPRGTNTNTLQEHHNRLVALNIPFHDASSRRDFNLSIQHENGYLEMPSNDYYHFNAHLNIFPTY